MATKLFLRETVANGIGAFRDMLVAAGASATTFGIVNTTAGGTQIQWTKTAGGAVLEWISGRVPVGGFTLAGTMSFSIWADESALAANCGGRVRVWKRSAAGVETEIDAGWNDGVEFTKNTPTEMTWTAPSPTSMAFAENDRIVVRYYITNVGTMGGGYICELKYDAADAATGDSFFQINENVTFKPELPPPITGTGNLTLSHAQAGSGSLGFLATGALVLLMALAGTGSETFLGSGGTSHGFSLAGSGAQLFSGSGGLVFDAALAGSGSQGFSGSGGLGHAFSMAGTGEVEVTGFTGAGNLDFLATLAGIGEQGFAGAGEVAFGFALGGTGEQRFSGSGDLTLVTALSGAGGQRFAGSGGLAYLAPLVGSGTVANPVTGTGGMSYLILLDGAGAVPDGQLAPDPRELIGVFPWESKVIWPWDGVI